MKKEITKLLLKGCTCTVCDNLRECKFYDGEYYCGPEPCEDLYSRCGSEPCEDLHSRRKHSHHPPLPEEGVCVYFKKREVNFLNLSLNHTHTIKI